MHLGGSLAALAAASLLGACARDPPHAPLALGAFIPGAPGDAAQIDAFARLVGAPPRVVMWYQDWARPGGRAFDPAQMDAVRARGAMPLVTWEPWDAAAGAGQPAFALRSILAGAHDDHIRGWARGAAAWGGPFYLRFAHEMNGAAYPWATGLNGNTPEGYVAAWRYVRDVFRHEGATAVRWVWSPTVIAADTSPLARLYPGDAEVDWVAMDGYNWGTTQAWSHWTDLATLFGETYGAIARITRKPMMIAETASTDAGGDKATWITRGLLTDLPRHLPNVRAVIWFDERKETDWRVESTPSALVAYRAAATSPRYSGALP